ncbi:hypothetical protein B0T24DRAFT_114445 [Lasiosphaeria ovina]|uniref:DOMON domain-containing protein n=1 Tax=Lasiosphaeria ovina TaxID=92902 RepID=A0AAE0JSM0_9PEZI|nr:hypothetical protein B0T24DRAFT_114445 [Lasiosphaeria ovina]
MKLLGLLSTLLVSGIALGSVVPVAVPGSELEEGLADAALNRLMRRTCTSNNCAREVTGTNPGLPPVTLRKADCSSFMARTVSYSTVTTVTSAQLLRRQQTIVPSNLPAYASSVCNASKYSSACSCWGITASTTTVTSVSTVTVAPALATHSGILQVKSGDTVLGYIAPDPNYWTPLLTADANAALGISFVSAAGATAVTQVDFTMTNDNRGVYFGFVVGRDSTSSDIAAGSFNYLYIDPISVNTAPGSTPQSVPSYFSTSTGLDKQAETALWNVDLATGAVTASWVNTDGTTTVPTVLFVQSNHVYGGGDAEAFHSRFPAPVTTVSITFVPT